MSCVRQVLHRRCKLLCGSISSSWGVHSNHHCTTTLDHHQQHHQQHTMTTPSIITLDTQQHIAIATLNRPKVLNALNTEMVDLLLNAYVQWSNDPAVHAIVLRGAGDKAFCAGGDVKGVVALAQQGNVEEAVRFFRHEYALNLAIHNLPKPHIALIDGITMGGGVGLSVHGPIRVATERTLFAMPECAIGLFPDVGGSWFLPRLPIPGMGLYLALTGARLSGMAVKHAGIATHFIRRARMPEVLEGLSRLGAQAGSVAEVDTMLRGLEQDAEEGGGLEHMEDIARVFGDAATLEEVYAQLRGKTDAWGVETYKQVVQGSPLSQCVTWEQLKRGAAATSLQECLEMEAGIAQRMVEGRGDFEEGVEAMLVRKSGKPVWKHQRVEDVGGDEVLAYFGGTTRGRL